ncbi:MAG: hypothetical protein AAF682_19370 [Planctomycetota bacterium]
MTSDGRQLELELDGEEPRGRERRFLPEGGAVVRAVCAWLPIAAAFALFAQLALLGLSPALVERHRLERAEGRVATREAKLLHENGRLLRQLRALSDPMFRARVERARRSEAFASAPRPLALPLTAPLRDPGAGAR